MEHEIRSPGDLLDSRGRLREPGWARTLLLRYDRKAVRAPAFRIKEWDYYCVLAGDTALAFTISDNGYMGFLSASALDLAAGAEATASIMTAFPMGRLRMPPHSASGVSAAEARGCSLRFEASDGVRRIRARWPAFGSKARGASARHFGLPGAPGLEADIVLREKAPRESMVIATPFAGRPHAFYYNQKINCLDAEGGARVGTREFRFAAGKAFGVLDWGRGVWTYSNTWLWGSASGMARMVDSGASVPFGFNIGYGFGDTAAASENMAFVDGKAHKFGRLAIELDDGDFMKPWHARSEDGRFDMVLAPHLDRAAHSDFLVLRSIQHQVFGKWSGSVTLEDGRKVAVEGLAGFCEKVRNRW